MLLTSNPGSDEARRTSEGPGKNAGLLGICLESACSDSLSVAHLLSLKCARLGMDGQVPCCSVDPRASFHERAMPCGTDPLGAEHKEASTPPTVIENSAIGSPDQAWELCLSFGNQPSNSTVRVRLILPLQGRAGKGANCFYVEAESRGASDRGGCSWSQAWWKLLPPLEYESEVQRVFRWQRSAWVDKVLYQRESSQRTSPATTPLPSPWSFSLRNW